MIRDFIRDNYVMIYELIGLLIMLRISAYASERTRRLTVAAIVLLLMEVLVYHLEGWTASFERLSLARPFLSACNYLLYPVILIVLLQITVPKRLTAKQLIPLLIPVAVCIPLYFTSHWTKLVFYFDKENSYHGGPLYYLPYMVFGLYCVIFLVNNIIYFRKYSYISRIVPAYITIGAILGVILYLFVLDRSNYSELFTSAILLYYLCIYIHSARIDSLTRLLNRQSYYHDITTYADRITGVVSVDMNELKYLNDNFGHEAGDEALKAVSAVMLDHSGKGGTVYRIGGDEFVILYAGTDEKELIAAIKRMKERLSETGYSCAFGYAMKNAGGDIEEAVKTADRLMYENKAAMKAEKAARGEKLHIRE